MGDFDSTLHPKHAQTLTDSLRRVRWLIRHFDDAPFMEVPSHLKSIQKSLEEVTDEATVKELNND